jgi:transcriptional regulator with XRE-family HTH domain
MGEKKVAGTQLALWLNEQLGRWRDPDTGEIGLSSNAFAKEVGVAQSLVWKILKAGGIPKPDILIRIAEFFDASPMFLFRIAYLDGEKGDQFSPEIRTELIEIERILADVPAAAQVHLLRSLVTQARTLKAALEALENAKVTE